MSVQCGWASADERGKASGGKAGDQTGKEVKTGNWYYFGQNVILRWKNRDLAAKAAAVCKKLCNNSRIGYDQNQRTTLFTEMQRVGWDPSKISKNVETDCSAMIAVICNAVGVKISKDVYTGNLKKALMQTGKFSEFAGATYCRKDEYCRTGDIILNEAKHVIMALEDGEGTKAFDKAKLAAAKASAGLYSGTFPVLPAKGYLHQGDEGSQVKNLQRFLNWYGNYRLAIDGSFGPATKTALKIFQKDHGLVQDGFFGPKTLTAAKKAKKKGN